MKICFIVGSMEIGGGTFVILQHADHLRRLGHDVTLGLDEPPSRTVEAWHPALERLRWELTTNITEVQDVVIATWWATAYDLWKVPARFRCYFVQSIESRFYRGDERAVRAAVDATYDFPVPAITEATWIQKYLETEHGRSVHLVRNGIAKDVYRPDGVKAAPPARGSLRILVEGPLGVPFKNVARTIAICRAADVGPVWLLTPTPIHRYPGVERVFSQVPVGRTAEIYRSCDVLVKLSYVEGMFGPPLEMFHCGGTALTYAVSGHDEYLVSNDNSVVVPAGDEGAVIAALRELHTEPDLLARLRAGGLSTAHAWPSWEESSQGFAIALGDIMATKFPQEARSHVAPIRADGAGGCDSPGRGRAQGRLRNFGRRWLASNHPRALEAAKAARYRAEARRAFRDVALATADSGTARVRALTRSLR
jgi:O-antigen biosynthesis protein